MAQLQKSIRDECARIASAYESDYEIALARQKSLQSSLNRLVSDETPTNLAQVKLRDLENSADSSRALLTGYLQKYQDASQLETFPISDARIITEAAAPLRPSDPKSLFVLAGVMLVGIISQYDRRRGAGTFLRKIHLGRRYRGFCRPEVSRNAAKGNGVRGAENGGFLRTEIFSIRRQGKGRHI